MKIKHIYNFKYYFLMTMVLIVNSIFSYIALIGDLSSELVNGKIPFNIVILSWLGIITLFFSVYTWNKVHNEIICPYVVFLFILYLFCYGQSFGWAIGIDNFYKDLLLRETQEFIIKAQSYTLPFISLFHLGALIASRKNGKCNNISNIDNCDNKALFTIGIIFLLISMPAFLINLYTTINLVINYGYGGIYYYKPQYSRIVNILLYAGEYFEPAVICILISRYKNKIIRNFSLVIFILNIITALYIGGRSGAAVSVLCILCIWHYLIKRVNIKNAFFLGAFAYLFMGILNATATIRGQAGHSVFDIINLTFSTGLTSISDLLGELGWSMSSVGYTMRFVPSIERFRYGSTYLYGLSTIIPNLGFWDIHPATVNAQLSNWLQSMLNISYGPGYTMIAETYINFGWIGIALAYFEGVIIGKILSKVNKETAHTRLSLTAFIMIFLIVGLKPLVRSSFVVAFRDIAYVLGGIYIVYVFIRNSYRKEIIKTVSKRG